MAGMQIRQAEPLPARRQFAPQYESSFGKQSAVEFDIYDDATRLLGQDALILGGYDLKDLFATKAHDSREIIKIIAQHGVLKLGEMEAPLVENGFKGRTSKTMSSADLEVNNWEAMWIEKLMQGKPLDPAIADERTVTVEAFAVAIRNASGTGEQGILFPILKRWQERTCPIEIWGLPAVRAVVSFKWNHWAKKYLLVEFVLYCLWTCIFMIEALTYHEVELRMSIQELWNGGPETSGVAHGRFIVVLSIMGCIFMLPFTIIEIFTFMKYRTRWFTVWNVIDVSTQVMQVICAGVYLAETDIEPNHFNLILAIQTILLLVKVQFFARAFVAVESSMMDMLGAVLRQLRWYLLVVALTIYCFTVAVFVLFRLEHRPDSEALLDYKEEECFGNEQPWDRLKECKPWECQTNDTTKYIYCISRPYLEFKDFFRALLTLYGVMMGAWEMDDYLEDIPFPGLSLGLFCAFMLLMSVLLYNLLIAMMIDSHARQMEVRKLWVHVSRAEIIDELETTLPHFITSAHQTPFIHVLRIVPSRNASLDSLWTQLDAAETSIAASKEELELELTRSERELLEAMDVRLCSCQNLRYEHHKALHALTYANAVISAKIRDTLGLSQQEYVKRLHAKLGISPMKTQNTIKRMTSRSTKRSFVSKVWPQTIKE